MQDILHDIIIHYPHANDAERNQLDEQLAKLKHFSDHFIEEWLQFEERMADFRELKQQCCGAGANQASPGGAMPRQQQPNAEYPKIISSVPQVMPQTASITASGEGEAKSAAAQTEASEIETRFLEAEADFELQQAMTRGQGYFKLFMFREAADHFNQAIAGAPDDNRARLFLGMTYMHLQNWHEAQRHFQLLVEVTEHPRWRALGYNALGCIQAVRMNLEQAACYFEKAHEADPEFTDPLANMKSCQEQAGHLSLYFGSGQL